MANKKLRAAIYARYSTNEQDRTSIEVQVQNCKAIAAREGFTVHDRHVFKDEAISGAKADRPGYLALKAAIKNREVDVILANETSRFTRVPSELHGLGEFLEQQRPKMHLITANGVDTRQDSWEYIVAFMAVADKMERRKIAFRTYGALRQRHQNGKSAGGKAYGYGHEDDSEGYRVRVVVAKEAKVVRSIFKMFADGMSHREIAAELNRDGIPSPGARWNRTDTGQDSKRRDGKWVGSTVYSMLRNPIYRGDVIWNRGEFFMSTSETGRTTRKKSKRPEVEWMVRHDESLRIVDDATWQRCRARMKETAERNGKQKYKGGRRRQRLFDLQCAECGGRYTMINGVQLGCASNKNGGDAACGNKSRVWLKDANQLLLAMLCDPDDGLLSDREIAAVRRDVVKEVQRRKRESAGRARAVPDEVRTLDERIARLRKRLAKGDADMEPDELQAAIDRAAAKREELMRHHGGDVAGDLDKLPDIVPDLMRRWREQVGALADVKPAFSVHQLAQARSLISEILDGPVVVDAELSAQLHAKSMVAGA